MSNELHDPNPVLQLPYAARSSSTHLTGCYREWQSNWLAQVAKYFMLPELCSSNRNKTCLFLPSLLARMQKDNCPGKTSGSEVGCSVLGAVTKS